MEQLLVKGNSWNEWWIEDRENVRQLSGTTIEILHTRENPIIVVAKYKGKGYGLLNEIKNKYLKEMYELKLELELEGKVQVEVQINLFRNNQLYKIEKETILSTFCLQVEEVDQMYMSLKLYGVGKIIFKDFTLKQIESIKKQIHYSNKKIEAFYRWSEEKKQDRKSIEPYFTHRIATIVDEFTYECLKYEAPLKQLSYKQWEEDMIAFKPDLLLVESAWEGGNKNWQGKIARFNQKADENLIRLIAYCKQHQIPTIFWDKEGANNLYYFIHTSSLFEYIGIVDENMRKIYEAMHPKEKVFVLPFAAQPQLHNSIGRMDYPLGKIAFAGSWYGRKYPERLKDIENIIDPALSYGLDIYDRNYDKDKNDNLMKWPEQYTKYIVGRLPYLNLIEAYKQYEIFLNIQSVKESKWMIPRRVYELLACGTPIISSESEGIKYQFLEDIYISRTPEDTKRLIKYILENPEAVQIQTKRSQEKIFKEYTYKKFLEIILNKIN